jgi:hypothetical protein
MHDTEREDSHFRHSVGRVLPGIHEVFYKASGDNYAPGGGV